MKTVFEEFIANQNQGKPQPQIRPDIVTPNSRQSKPANVQLNSKKLTEAPLPVLMLIYIIKGLMKPGKLPFLIKVIVYLMLGSMLLKIF